MGEGFEATSIIKRGRQVRVFMRKGKGVKKGESPWFGHELIHLFSYLSCLWVTVKPTGVQGVKMRDLRVCKGSR